MRKLIAISTVALALAAPGMAGAGGWATVGFTPLPDETLAGGTWEPQITVLQHGVRPLAGLQPTLTIENVSSGDSRSFTASPTTKTGVYEASVVFPNAGQWRVAVASGFGDSGVTYGPVAIGEAPVAPGGREGWFPVLAVLAVVGTLALAVAGLLGTRRLRRLNAASR